MKKLMRMMVAAAALGVATVAFADPEVTDVTAAQRYPWNGLVDIRCKVAGIESGYGSSFIVSAVMPGSGEVRELSSVWVVRDGERSSDLSVTADGKYQLLWDARADLGQVEYDNMVLRVTVGDLLSRGKVQLWEGGPYWADRNIGADKPEDYGLYFWWGDTKGHSPSADGTFSFSFDRSNCPTYDKDDATLNSEGWMSGGVLAPAHDAAHVKWGGAWRMPTAQELSDLNSKCDWTLESLNGVNGCVVRGRGAYSGNSIFLPAAGCGDDTMRMASLTGFYWSSRSQLTTLHYSTWFLHFADSNNHEITWEFGFRRYRGYTIRSVQGATDSAKSLIVSTTAPFRLSTTDGTRVAQKVEMISFSTDWGNGSSVRVAVDGMTAFEDRAPASGDWLWNAATAGAGVHTLTHTSGGETLTASFEVVASEELWLEGEGGTTAEGHLNECIAVVPGADVTLPAKLFTRPGWAFMGWALESKGTVVYEDGATVPSDVGMLFAVWRETGFMVFFHANGGTGAIDPLYVEAPGDTVTLPKNDGRMKQDGHVLVGWSSHPGGYVEYADGATAALSPTDGTQGLDLYAKWELASLTGQMTFVGEFDKGLYPDYGRLPKAEKVVITIVDLASRLPTVTCHLGDTVTLPVSNYKISASYVEDKKAWEPFWGLVYGGRTAYSLKTGEVLTETLGFRLARYSPNLRVTFDSARGTVSPARMTYTLDDSGSGMAARLSELPAVTEPSDYVFQGWWTSREGSGTEFKKGDSLPFSSVFERIEDGDFSYDADLGGYDFREVYATTLYARWKSKYYDFVVIEDDGELTGVELNGATDITIPEGVTSIASGAFQSLSELKSVTISAGVTNIHAWAFDGCSGLESITVADDNPEYKSANNVLLTKDGTTLVQGVNGDVVIPSGVTTVGDSAFYQLSGLTSVEIPDGVTTIEDYAFGGSALTSVTIPASVAGIGDRAFGYCGSLERLVFLGNAPVVDSSAFEVVGSGCTVYVEKGSTGWGVDIPGIWNGMRIKYSDDDKPGHDSVPELPEGYGTYIDGTYTWVYRESYFADGIGLTGFYRFTDPSDYSQGGEYMRGVYPAPTGKVTIPSTVNGLPVVELGDYLFWDCADLTGVEIPDTVQFIGTSVFEGSGLVSVELPDSVVFIGDYAFWNVPLESVNVPSDIGYVGDRAFYGTPWLAAQGEFVFFGDGYLIAYQGVDVDVAIPGSVAEIGPGAFARTSVESVRIPASVDLIRDRAFYMCESLAEVSFEGDMNDILMDVELAFEGTPWLENLVNVEPSNDNFANAVVLEGRSGSVRGLSIGASVEDGEPLAARWDSTASLWWRWTAPSDGMFSFDTVGATFDTVLGVYTGDSVAALTAVAENDDGEDDSIGSVSAVSFEATAGTTYYISVAGYRDASGSVMLSWSDSYWYATVYFNAAGGEVSEATRNVYSGQKVGPLPIPVRDGYEFVGWFDEDGGQMTPDTIIHYGVEIFARWRLADNPDEPQSEPGPGPTPTPEPVVMPELYEAVEDAAPAAASVYDGYLVDAKGNVAGSIQVKVGKPGKDGQAAVKATVVIGAAKASLKADGGKVAIAASGPTTMRLVGGDPCEVTLGAEGLSGSYGSYLIDGARNFFSSKDKGEQNAANGLLASWLGPVNVVWDDGNASVAIGKKGKAKVTVTLADGTKATANAQLLVGEEWLCVPVVVTKKTSLAFTLWLPRNGGAALVDGLSDDAVVGKPGALVANAAFRVGKSAALWQQIPGTVLVDYLPDGMAVTQSGAKWTLPKAGKVQKAKDGTIGSSKLGENPSALKLTYKAKDGSFKGSFKVYADNGGKLKATTVNVTGVVVDGTGYGTATIKKVGSVPIRIE